MPLSQEKQLPNERSALIKSKTDEIHVILPPKDGVKNDVDNIYIENGRRDSFKEVGTCNEKIQETLIHDDSDIDVDSLINSSATATISNEVFNLVKNIVGCGVLSLPSGIASFGNKQSAVYPASGLILITGIIFAYYFLLLGKICKGTTSKTYRESWEKTLGGSGSTVVSTINFLKPALGNLSYSIILADTLQSLMVTAGFTSTTRTEALLAVTTIALLPLCLLKNINVLTPFSIAGLVGILFTSVAMGIRYFDGSYDVASSGKFVNDLPENLQPIFGTVGAMGAFSSKVLILMCMLFEAFIAHYNAPRFYMELKDNTITRFGYVTASSFLLSSFFYILIASFGFLTFGSNSNGYILNNYSTNDRLATMSRIAIFISVVFTYPVVFIGFRDGVFDALTVSHKDRSSKIVNLISILLLFCITLLASFISNLGKVNAIGGGSLGTVIVFVFPTLMFAKMVEKLGSQASYLLCLELNFAFILMCMGVLMGFIGVWNAMILP